MKIYVAHSGAFDFEKELYEVLERSRLSKDHEFFFPEKSVNKIVNTLNVIKNDIDLLIAEISFPATGLGIELGRAESAEVPIVCVYRKGSKFSSSIRFVTKNFIEYEGPEDLIGKVANFISSKNTSFS